MFYQYYVKNHKFYMIIIVYYDQDYNFVRLSQICISFKMNQLQLKNQFYFYATVMIANVF